MELSNTSIRYLIVIALVTMFAALAHAQSDTGWEEEPNATLVGRISHLEGTLSRYDADQADWVATNRDAPVGSDDRLQSAPDARAEVILPNNSWIRMDGDTEVQLVAMTKDSTEMDLSFGTARFYNKSSHAEIKTSTPFGHVIIPTGSTADLYVYDDGVEIIALKNRVYFVHLSSNHRHDIQAGAGSIFADTQQVVADRGDGSPGWQKWNKEMDALWAMRSQTKGESTTYLPAELQHDAYALDTHGRWERVYYNGGYYRFWRPVHVHAGWTPFSSGIWRVRWGDHVWIPYEPFGYVTHHYGNWIFASNHWYWAPPVTRAMVYAGLPLIHIGFNWYPGRVAWLHTSVHIGWFPLGPYEPYYSHRRWGRRSIVVTKNTHYHRHRHKYRHRHHATVIHRAHLYRGKNYRNARVKTISRATLDRKFRTVPVIQRPAVKTHGATGQKARIKGRGDLRRPHPNSSRENHRNRLTKRNVTPERRVTGETRSTRRRSGTINNRTVESKPTRGRSDLRRPNPNSSRENHRNRLTKRNVTPERRVTGESRSTRRRSGTINNRTVESKPTRRPQSVNPDAKNQSRERQKVRSRDQRQTRINAQKTDKRRTPGSSQARSRRNPTLKPAINKPSTPNANQRQKIRRRQNVTRSANRDRANVAPQERSGRTASSRKRVKQEQRASSRQPAIRSPQAEQRRTYRVKPKHAPRVQSKGRVHNRTQRQQNQGRSYQTRRNAPQKYQNNRANVYGAGGRRGSRSGR